MIIIFFSLRFRNLKKIFQYLIIVASTIVQTNLFLILMPGLDQKEQFRRCITIQKTIYCVRYKNIMTKINFFNLLNFVFSFFQVFGCKKIILYHPEERDNLYPYDTRLLYNTAQVDPINPDYKKFPKFKKTKGLMCYLKPGEMLYIPPGWWHYVVSLTPSFSISFWWS